MHGLISDRPLLISSLLEHAARYHGKTEIISADSKDKITRSNYENVNIRSKKIAQALIKLGAKNILIKGCASSPIPTWAYMILVAKLAPYANKILFGELCSAYEIYKK